MEGKKSNISNEEAARVLKEIGELLSLKNVPFKPQAYARAAESVRSHEESIGDLYERKGEEALLRIPGIGRAIAEKLAELFENGKSLYHASLKKDLPVDLSDLLRIQGLGSKSIKRLYDERGIRTVRELEREAKKGSIAGIPGFGEKTQDNILKSIAFLKKSGGRAVLGFVMPRIRGIEDYLNKFRSIDSVVVAGSARRRRETIGDIDILAVVGGEGSAADREAKAFMEYAAAMPGVERVLARGGTKTSVRMDFGLNVDVRVVPKESYGAALSYFTGSKEHNIALREIAIRKGFILNEYGLFRSGAGKRNRAEAEMRIAGESEEGIYNALGMDYIEPELRENRGEVNAAEQHCLPKLIGYGDLQGDLQVQTNWTDGAGSIAEVAREAERLGLRYIAVTDHTKRLAMAHGLDERRIKKQWLEIERVNGELAEAGSKLRVLKGTECDILKDGSLDLPDAVLAELDVVGVSVHSHFSLSSREQTERIMRAMENPHVDILFHPTGRVLGKREAYAVDMEALVRSARRTRTIMEVDAYPDRLDLRDEHVRLCVEAGVKISIDSDAHSADHFSFLEYGIAAARRGWARRDDVVNTRPLEEMLALLK